MGTSGGTGAGLYGSDTAGSAIRAATAELVGTFILVLAGIAVATAAILDQPTAGAAYDSLAVALAFGLALAAIVTALGHISGAHLNPAVTLGLTVTGKFPLRLAPVYVLAQVTGAVLAALATWAVFGAEARSDAGLAATGPAADTSVAQAFLVEVVVTFVLLFIVVSVATDDRVPAATASSPRHPLRSDRRCGLQAHRKLRPWGATSRYVGCGRSSDRTPSGSSARRSPT